MTNGNEGWLSLVIDRRPRCEKCSEPVDEGRDMHRECEEEEDSWIGLILRDGNRL
jgi:hypothetical protein